MKTFIEELAADCMAKASAKTFLPVVDIEKQVIIEKNRTLQQEIASLKVSALQSVD